jgi:hypothetical protein
LNMHTTVNRLFLRFFFNLKIIFNINIYN